MATSVARPTVGPVCSGLMAFTKRLTAVAWSITALNAQPGSVVTRFVINWSLVFRGNREIERAYRIPPIRLARTRDMRVIWRLMASNHFATSIASARVVCGSDVQVPSREGARRSEITMIKVCLLLPAIWTGFALGLLARAWCTLERTSSDKDAWTVE